MKKLLINLIKRYQQMPFKSHDSCKFIPTCSNYMIEALEVHGLIKGLYLGIKRLTISPELNETTINSITKNAWIRWKNK